MRVPMPARARSTAIVSAASLVLAACGADPTGDTAPAVRTLMAPSAAGSAQPRLTAGPDATPILSWLEPGTAGTSLRFARLDEGRWAAPVTVVTGRDLFVNWADFPSVNAIADDYWVAHWLRLKPGTYGAYDVVTAVSSDRGATWSEPRKLNDDDTDTEHGFADVFARGEGAAAVWLDGRELANWSFDEPEKLLGTSLRYAALDRGGRIADRGIVDDLVCDCCQPDVAFAAGRPIVAYRDRTPEEIRDIVVRRGDGAGFAEPVALGDDHWQIDGCPVNGPAIAARGDAVAVAWFTAAAERPRVRLARSSDAGVSFGTAIDVDGEMPFGQVGLVLEADGTAVVSWWRRAPGGGTDLAVRTVAPDGALGAITVVGHESVAQPIDVPQLLGVGDALLVAWTTFAGEGGVRLALVEHLR